MNAKLLKVNNLLFTQLTLDEQNLVSGGLYEELALSTQLTSPTGSNTKGFIAQDAQGNCVTLDDLFQYITRTTGQILPI